eukprot:m.29628 g.29628  ORF g.29628 m.29628 type:complete len:132 (+) comp31202_c0_seq1:1002-1397(+)
MALAMLVLLLSVLLVAIESAPFSPSCTSDLADIDIGCTRLFTLIAGHPLYIKLKTTAVNECQGVPLSLCDKYAEDIEEEFDGSDLSCEEVTDCKKEIDWLMNRCIKEDNFRKVWLVLWNHVVHTACPNPQG